MKTMKSLPFLGLIQESIPVGCVPPTFVVPMEGSMVPEGGWYVSRDEDERHGV